MKKVRKNLQYSVMAINPKLTDILVFKVHEYITKEVANKFRDGIKLELQRLGLKNKFTILVNGIELEIKE
jgi:hypothetical protein